LFLPTESCTLESPTFNTIGEVNFMVNNVSYVDKSFISPPTITIEPIDIRGSNETKTELVQTTLENSHEELTEHMHSHRGGKYMSYSPGNTPKINENRKKKRLTREGHHKMLSPNNEKSTLQT